MSTDPLTSHTAASAGGSRTWVPARVIRRLYCVYERFSGRATGTGTHPRAGAMWRPAALALAGGRCQSAPHRPARAPAQPSPRLIAPNMHLAAACCARGCWRAPPQRRQAQPQPASAAACCRQSPLQLPSAIPRPQLLGYRTCYTWPQMVAMYRGGGGRARARALVVTRRVWSSTGPAGDSTGGPSGASKQVGWLVLIGSSARGEKRGCAREGSVGAGR